MDTSIKIKKDIKNFLEQMGFYFLNPPTVEQKEDHFFVNIFIANPQGIHTHNEGLQSIQHLFQVLITHQHGPNIRVTLDINGYRKKRESFIRQKAFSARKKCLATQKDVLFPPMNSYDRRIIHSTLVSFQDIKTNSSGQGKDRRVVVRLA